ncbi:MAG: ABC transporter permease subunit [Acidobacteria bacterium]|nr:ABC transporter permease subunit [Acidobacteriota bacterium]
MSSLVQFWQSHASELWALLGQHLALVLASTVVAVAAGVPIGIVAARRPRIGGPLAGAASVVQTIPSLALFGFLLPLPLVGGIGARTALAALILYALLPIIRTTAAGLRSIDPAILEAADAMGMTPRQRLTQVELPLALPSIVAGIRVAAVIGVGTVTIAAAIGAGGLGEYIYRGLSMVDATVILAGAIPVAALALSVDGVLFAAERALSWRGRRRRASRAAVAVVAGTAAIGLTLTAYSSEERIVVGSKNFTEQVVLGELMAQAIERYAGLPVDRRLNLGGTFICDRALQTGDIDLYVEYSGTALTAVFKQPVQRDPAAVLDTVRTLYADTGRTMLSPLGFNNTFAILVRSAEARARGLTRLSQLAAHAPGWRAAFGYEFLERADGYRGLAESYGLRFREPPRVMDLTLIYRALADGQVDVIAGDATAGLIEALDLRALEDDRQYFPPYDAVPVVHAATLLRHPEIAAALGRLSGRVTAEAMRRMNYAVDGELQDPLVVVRAFLDGLES